MNNDEDYDATSLICLINDINNKVQIINLLQHLLKKHHMIMNLHVTHDSRLQTSESCFHTLHDEDDDETLNKNINHDEICSWNDDMKVSIFKKKKIKSIVKKCNDRLVSSSSL